MRTGCVTKRLGEQHGMMLGLASFELCSHNEQKTGCHVVVMYDCWKYLEMPFVDHGPDRPF